jgi:protein involved in polysaccharide export with SLBB domain
VILRRLLLLPLLLVSALLCAADTPEPAPQAYRLYPLDMVTFAVHGETGLGATLRLSGGGTINVPLLGDVSVSGLTLAEAEKKIQDAYVAQEIFIRPQITIQVTEYSKKEVSVLGQIARQGRIEFPAEAASLDIVEVVTAAGGFSRIGRADAVRVTRKDPTTGEEKVFTVNVERMLAGRADEPFRIYPGDVLFVPERLF